MQPLTPGQNLDNMKILIACEESQEVCLAFRRFGHEAYSCDLQDCSGGFPEWHIKGDAIQILNGQKWDIVIAHPPCTRLCNSGVRWLDERNLWKELQDAIDFFNVFVNYGKAGNKIRIENPIPHKYAKLPPYSQVIQPWQFGHKEMKATCLWNYNLPNLRPSNIVGPPPTDKEERRKWQSSWATPPGPERAKIRSKTFSGIAEAMAAQCGRADSEDVFELLFR